MLLIVAVLVLLVTSATLGWDCVNCVAVSKTKYQCDGFYPIEAADLMHAAQLFAVQIARRKYGPQGRRRHCLAYSITLSARARMLSGIVTPSNLVVLRFIASSNFVGCSTGRSAGLAPLSILST
jgi:hypothetical protein